MEAESLYREFSNRAVPSSGGGLLLRPEDALQLVNRAAEAGVPILRVDGVHLTPDGARPEEAADFSADAGQGHGCWTDAEAFVRDHRDRGLVFAITLGDDPINAA